MTRILRGLLLSLIVITAWASSANTHNNQPAKVLTQFADVTVGKSLIFRTDVVDSGTISGKITRDDGVTAIAAATVKALQGNSTIASTTTNATGDYTLSQLAVGTYMVEASAASFSTKLQSLVSVAENATTTVNLKLDAIVTGAVSYLYDAAGRLVATVGPAETTIYSYDAVGNLLSISRQPSNQLAIISVVPNRGVVGQVISIYGTGFSAVSSENTVQFNGTAAAVMSSTSTRIITSVPSLGVTGQIQISVTTSQGTVNAPFTVLPAETAPSITVSPQYVSILPQESLQFFASVSGVTGDQSVTWSVNGVNGGNSDIGTISANGFYISANLGGSIFTIRATSVANPSVFGQAQVAVLQPSQAEAIITRAITVFRQPLINSEPSTSITVRRSSVESVSVSAPVVTVRRMPPTESGGPIADGVSVRRLSPTESGAPMTQAVSVRRWMTTESLSPQSADLSVTKGPIIQSITPGSVAKGTNVTVTIVGANFDGATGLSFLTTAGAVDTTITASNISVNANGTELTATVTVSAGSALGQRVVVVAAAAAHSLAVDVGSNRLEIIQ